MPRPQPEAADPRQVERPGIPEERLGLNPLSGHAVIRRLPRPRQELPRVSSATAGHAPRQGRQARLRRRPAVQDGGPPHLHPTSTWVSTARLPLRADRTCTASATSTAMAAASRSPAATATAPRQVPDAAHLRPAGALAAWTCRSSRTQDGRKRVEVAGRQALPALGHLRGPRVGDVAREGLGDAGQPEVQREGGARQAHARRRRRPERAVGPRREGIRPRRREDDVLHLPSLVDHELRRLPPAHPGQLEDRAPALRGRRDEELRQLQPAGGARRHVPARQARPGEGGRFAPSPSALVLSSTNINRERIYIQQAPVAASGFSSQAFAPHYPHTERKTETKGCADCHVSDKGDNNAIMAQLLLQGTNFVNFVGFNAWMGQERTGRPQVTNGGAAGRHRNYLHRTPSPTGRRPQKRGRRPRPHDHRRAPRAALTRGILLLGQARECRLRRPSIAKRAFQPHNRALLAAGQTSRGSRTRTCVALRPTSQRARPSRAT